ncbi:hypothetical protein BS50DRAFT_26556 [Corynespora cassiicola Philippines]|uniref:Uncharacterized protein n=1 Tax=Corynespora cassiicola Philippines TaxID=1448308 RepID=A0A2T2PB57_CORCC|nr:hypothetical protein BS50DRAFT_26556 [Corynespora cassiicola Philippines]
MLPAGSRPVCLQWTARRRRRSVRDPGSSMALARPVHSSRRYWYGTVAACVPMARLVTRPPWPTLPFAALHASLAGLLCRRTRRNPAQMSGMVLVGSIRPLCKKRPLAARPTWGGAAKLVHLFPLYTQPSPTGSVCPSSSISHAGSLPSRHLAFLSLM